MRLLLALMLISLPAMGLEKPDVTAWKQAQELPNNAPLETSLDSNGLLGRSSRYSMGLDVKIDRNGQQTITPYHQLNLTPEKSVSLLFEHYKPRVKFKAGGINTAVKLRGDGLKLQFNPTDKRIPLQVEVKLTDDESSLRFDYRF
ncbi:hypothetical protein [Aeromonas simiae]|uniref:hypothetical protein n=1 Tax=Aeromonas simiae TaxID=218936 RepID=UPI00266D429F|nr:hypothetical protein [Aeromonas simiae]MDO2950737.1 hypothetical protein [Aeromonas simiae]